MKILQINNNHYRLGGAETVYLNTIELLKSKNHEVISFSRKNPKTILHGGKEFFINQSESFVDRFYSRDAANQITNIIQKEKPQIVHLHSIIGGITFSILPVIKKYNIPIIITLHDFRLLCPAAHFWNGQYKVCEKCVKGKYYMCILNKCSPQGKTRSLAIATESYLRDFLFPYSQLIDAFIFVSKFSQRKFLSANNEIKLKSHIIYNFTNDFELNNEMGSYFLYFGRLEYEKGIETLLSAFEKLPNVKLKIAGSGTLLRKLQTINLPNIELLGQLNKKELNEVIKKTSFVVVPSECYENNPMSIVESFALGKPVIGSNLGGIIELIDEGKNGFRFEPENQNKLIELVEKCSNIESKEYNNLSEQAYRFAEGNFTSKIYYNALIKVYEDALSKMKFRK